MRLATWLVLSVLVILLIGGNAAAAGRSDPVQAPALTVTILDEYDPLLMWNQQAGVNRYYVWLYQDNPSFLTPLPFMLDDLPGDAAQFLWTGGLPIEGTFTFVIEARGDGAFVRSNTVTVHSDGSVSGYDPLCDKMRYVNERNHLC